MFEGDDPEIDAASPLDDDSHNMKYHMLAGKLNWIVCLGLSSIAFPFSLLSYFTEYYPIG